MCIGFGVVFCIYEHALNIYFWHFVYICFVYLVYFTYPLETLYVWAAVRKSETFKQDGKTRRLKSPAAAAPRFQPVSHTLSAASVAAQRSWPLSVSSGRLLARTLSLLPPIGLPQLAPTHPPTKIYKIYKYKIYKTFKKYIIWIMENWYIIKQKIET